MTGIINRISNDKLLKKFRADRKKKRQGFERIIRRFDSPKIIRDGFASGEIVQENIGEFSGEFMYLYTQADSDYWLRMSDLIIVSTDTKFITKVKRSIPGLTLRNETDYEQALKLAEIIFDIEDGPFVDTLEDLAEWIEEYEDVHYPIPNVKIEDNPD